MLVVFGEHVILFSDKVCAYPLSSDPKIAWSRWYRRAISASAEQLFGAERWIRSHPNRLFLDRNCQHRLPVNLPEPSKLKVHRVVVANGASEACKSYANDDIGSLVIDTSLEGLEAHNDAPFSVGHIDRKRGFVHVFDEANVGILLTTLDTISDFVRYLEKKEKFLTLDRKVWAAGEEELLAYYLGRTNDEKLHDFVVDGDFTSLGFDKGFWKSFQSNEQRRRQLEADSISYMWDALIETFTDHVFGGTLRTASSQVVAHQELLFRWLAREPRIRRRMLSNALAGLIRSTPPDMRACRIVEPSYPGDPYFVFVVVPEPQKTSAQNYREFRESLLIGYCQVLKIKYPNADTVVGIATEAGVEVQTRSEDAVYIDLSEWTEEDQAFALSLQKEHDLLTHTVRRSFVDKEYPDSSRSRRDFRLKMTISRNKKCPCKSGKRYRHCCGKAHYESKKSGP